MKRKSLVKTSKTVMVSKGNPMLRIFLLLFLLIALSLLTFLSLIYTRNSAEGIQRELCRKIQVAAEQACSNVDYRFEQVKEGAMSLVGTIYPYLNDDSDIARQAEEYAEICRTMNEYIDKHMISFLRLYVPDEKIYADQISMSYSFNALKDLGAEAETYKKGGVFWDTTHSVRLGDGISHDVITCIVAVKRLSNYEELTGVLCADVAVKQFHEIFADGTSDYEHMYLVDETGTVLAQGDEEELTDRVIPEDIMQQIRLEKDGYLMSAHMVYAFDNLETTNWYVVSTCDLGEAGGMNPDVIATIIVVWIAMFLILTMVIVAMAYSRNLNKTVRGINAAIRILEVDREAPFPEDEEAEHKRKRLRERFEQVGLTSLEKDAEQIVLSINGIVEGRYRDRLAVSEYRMESLQAQIKPHFLYNTLDAIKWMIMDKNTEDAVRMVNALSRYLRISINKGDQIVSLEEEVALMRIYFEIMQRRFRDKFEVEYDLAEETLPLAIPKLSLQPLVENALLHGILHSEKPDLRLTVRSWCEDSDFVVQIEDNGCGMSPEKAAYLSQVDIREETGYGVANVHKRLDIFGHGQCRFTVESKEGAGTCVTIELPARKKETGCA